MRSRRPRLASTLPPVLLLLLATGCRNGGGGTTTGAGGSSGGTTATTGAGGGQGQGGAGGTAPGFSQAALLGAFGTCATNAAADFRARAVTLAAATAALAATPGDAARAAARDAFRQAMAAWQVVEMMQFGPTASRTLPGGQEMRAEIYSWPQAGRCATEQLIASRGYQAATFPMAFVNQRGLATLEYLLFYEGTDTICSPSSETGQAWPSLTADELATRKRDYAAAAAAEMVQRAGALFAAWDPAAGNFGETLRTAGGNAVYPALRDGRNAVANALFYIESEVKDRKLGPPLGVDMQMCPAGPCPELLESQFAGLSKLNVASNIEGMRRLLEGCGPDYEGLGFDDLLENLGQGSMAQALRDRDRAARAALDAIEEPDLAAALQQDAASVRALYDGLKSVTDILKTEFVTVLDVDLPGGLVGDND